MSFRHRHATGPNAICASSACCWLAWPRCLAALVYLLLVSPAQTGIDRYNRSLPELRQQVAQLQALTREAVTLPQGDAAGAARCR